MQQLIYCYVPALFVIREEFSESIVKAQFSALNELQYRSRCKRLGSRCDLEGGIRSELCFSIDLILIVCIEIEYIIIRRSEVYAFYGNL